MRRSASPRVSSKPCARSRQELAVVGFMDWLIDAKLEECKNSASWSVEQPFFRVPAGKGALLAFEHAAWRQGVKLCRRIDEKTGGRSVFITAGIPGSVGSAARDIWQGLVAARKASLPFRASPFEGPLEALLGAKVPVVAEIYPRAAYATALVDDAPRPRLAVAKSKENKDDRGKTVRDRAIEHLREAIWVKASGARVYDTESARDNEDDFDALFTAAALLRCLIEDLPLYASPLHAPAIEGAILGTGSIDLTLPEKTFK